MKRRTFIQATAAAGLAATTAPYRMAIGEGTSFSVDKAIVIGAGIVGASIAYKLSKRGCEVLVLDKIGPAAQASGNSFAWINASYFDMPDSYFQLRTQSLNEYHRLADDLEIPIHWGGSLEWYHSTEQEQEVSAGIQLIQAQGAPAWMVDAAQVAEIEPGLDLMGNWKAAFCSRDGAVDPAGTTRALIDGHAWHGGSIIAPANVSSVDEGPDSITVTTDVGEFNADLVVVAAGVGANDIAGMIGLGTDLIRPATPGIIVTTCPMDRLLNTVCYTTDSHFQQLSDGRVLIGEKAGAPQTEQHNLLLTGLPNAYPTAELAADHAERVIDTASRYINSLANAEVESVGVGWRPLPLDGLPTVGHVPDTPRVYLASMHSGVTLAPIIGHFAAMEILDGVRVSPLDDFRVERFL